MPALIEARVNDVTYKLRINPQTIKVVHFDKLRPYLSTDIPKWMIPIRDKVQGVPVTAGS